MILSYQPFSDNHLEAAANLALQAYTQERQHLPFLPPPGDFTQVISQRLVNLHKRGAGLAALVGGELAGFILGVEIPELWGRCRGFYSPLYANAAKGIQRSQIYQDLYTELASMLVEKHIYSHALTIFANDQEVLNTWTWLGFGGRCIDSIREARPLAIAPHPAIEVRKLSPAEVPGLADNLRIFRTYMASSPLFMQTDDGDPVQEMKDWLAEESNHLWAAYRNDLPLGHIRIQPEGETFISDHPWVMNITSAFVRPDARQTGVGALLLNAVQEWLQAKGYPLCGVDFESFNVTGGRFWNRHFTPYTRSLTRRIDERR